MPLTADFRKFLLPGKAVRFLKRFQEIYAPPNPERWPCDQLITKLNPFLEAAVAVSVLDLRDTKKGPRQSRTA